MFVVVFRFWNPLGGHEKAVFGLIRNKVESLMFTNHAINFLLYCLSGAKFRSQASVVLSRAASFCRQVARAGGASGGDWQGDRDLDTVSRVTA